MLALGTKIQSSTFHLKHVQSAQITENPCCLFQGLVSISRNSHIALHFLKKQFFGHVGSYFPDQGSNLAALAAWSLNHWTTREDPTLFFFFFFFEVKAHCVSRNELKLVPLLCLEVSG